MVHVSAVTYTETNPDVSEALFNSTVEIDPAKLADNEVLIAALGIPINPSDRKQIDGSYKLPITFQKLGQDANEKEVAVGGNEGAFRVIAIGAKVKEYKIEDVVILKLTSFGTWRSHAIVRITEENPDPLIVLGSRLSIDDAATISTNPSSAYQLFHDYVHDWNEGDWIVTNAGNSFVNKYLFQILKHHKVKSLAVVRSKPNWDEVVDELTGLGATKVITEEEFVAPDFTTSKLPDIVGSGRVRIAYDSLGGHTTPNLAASLSNDGIFVNYGALSGGLVSFLPSVQLAKNLTFKSYWLTRNTRANPQSKVDTVKSLLKLFDAGVFQPVNYTKVKFNSGDNLRDVFVQAINDSKHGKRVVMFGL